MRSPSLECPGTKLLSPYTVPLRFLLSHSHLSIIPSWGLHSVIAPWWYFLTLLPLSSALYMLLSTYVRLSQNGAISSQGSLLVNAEPTAVSHKYLSWDRIGWGKSPRVRKHKPELPSRISQDSFLSTWALKIWFSPYVTLRLSQQDSLIWILKHQITALFLKICQVIFKALRAMASTWYVLCKCWLKELIK